MAGQNSLRSNLRKLNQPKKSEIRGENPLQKKGKVPGKNNLKDKLKHKSSSKEGKNSPNMPKKQSSIPETQCYAM